MKLICDRAMPAEGETPGARSDGACMQARRRSSDPFQELRERPLFFALYTR
jgi:hypothetical protein